MAKVRKISRSALVPYSAREMYALVDDIETYPEFLPWCEGAVVRSRTAGAVEASLDLHIGAFRKTLTTRNRQIEGECIDIDLAGGPFRQLSGGWQFLDLGEDGSKATLELAFEFESRLLDTMVGANFEKTCNSLVDAFTQRAADVYGRR